MNKDSLDSLKFDFLKRIDLFEIEFDYHSFGDHFDSFEYQTKYLFF